MAAESAQVVAYVLKVDAKNAEKSLKSMERTTQTTSSNVIELGRASDVASNDLKKLATETKSANVELESLEKSAEKGSKGVEKLGKQSKISQKNARNLRRAGRDIDGAMGDLSQGLGLVSPSLAAFAMSISNAASLTDGFGRTLTAFVNPAFLATAGVIGVVLGAIEVYKHTAGETAKAQKLLADNIKASNEVIKKQGELVKASQASYDNLAISLQSARNEQRLLKGEISETEALEFSIRNSVEQRVTVQRKNLQDQIFGLKRQRMEFQILAEQEKKLGTFRMRQHQNRMHNVEQQIEAVQKEQKELDKTAQRLADQAVSNEKLRRRQAANEKQRAANAKKRADDHKANQKALREELKLLDQIRKKVRDRASAELNLRQQLLTLTGDLESQLKLVVLQRDQSIKQAQEMGHLVGDENLLIDIQLGIYREAEKQMQKIREEHEKVNNQLTQQIKQQKELGQLRGEQISGVITGATSLASDPIGASLNLAAQNIEPIMAAGGASTAATAAAGPIAMAVVEAIGALGALGAKTPQQIQEEALAMTDAIIVGLEILPTILLRVLPPVLGRFMFEFQLALMKLPFLFIDAAIAGAAELFKEVQKFFTDGSFREAVIGNPVEDVMNFLKAVVDPNVDAFAGGGRMVSAQGGIRFTGSQNGLAMLHKGEFVVPQSGQRPQQVDRALKEQSGGGGITINLTGTLIERNAIDELVRRLERRFGSFGQGQTSLFGRA